VTAENQGRGADALMAAITGEPLTDEVRADAAFMAEHDSAAADLALLREQLDMIGHALAEPPAPEPSPAPAPVRQPTRARRRIFTVALGSLAVAAAASVLAGMGWLLTQAGSGADSDAGASKADQAVPSMQSGDTDFGSPHYLACSRVVAEGRATSVEQVPGAASVRVTLDMTRYYKPDKGERELTFVVDENLVPGLRKGDQVLIGIPQGASRPDFWAVGEQDIAPERAWITASLSKARELGC
jgi:anti-sigma factor RsiW